MGNITPTTVVSKQILRTFKVDVRRLTYQVWKIMALKIMALMQLRVKRTCLFTINYIQKKD